MTNLFNINTVTFRGKVLNNIKTNDINLATDTFEPDELVTMKSIESWIKQSSTSKVELIDMIQNACWYIDSSESEFKNTFTELYYNLELEKTTDDSFIISNNTVQTKDVRTFLIPTRIIDINTDREYKIEFSNEQIINFTTPNSLKKLIISDMSVFKKIKLNNVNLLSASIEIYDPYCNHVFSSTGVIETVDYFMDIIKYNQDTKLIEQISPPFELNSLEYIKINNVKGINDDSVEFKPLHGTIYLQICSKYVDLTNFKIGFYEILSETVTPIKQLINIDVEPNTKIVLDSQVLESVVVNTNLTKYTLIVPNTKVVVHYGEQILTGKSEYKF